MSDLTDRLRHWQRYNDDAVRMTPAPAARLSDDLTAAADALDAAEAKLAAIDALHTPSPKNSDVQWCGHCNRWWPCPTHRILHPEADA